ncbi:MAG TPA: ROK family protein [Patescibacteria group bacterium]|nr:ROK family protein [Patescibacteria group bacterium]
MAQTKSFCIGIDLGGTNLKAALLDRTCRIIDKRVLSTASFRKKEHLIQAVAGSVDALLVTHKLTKNQVLGVGLGLPGPVDADKGIVHFFPNIPGWKEVDLGRILHRRLGIPVFLDNDANLMSLAEYTLGAARASRNAVCLTLGTGVGGGIIIEGRLYRGSGYAAGEIGHMPLNERGRSCNCGGSACLEAYVGNRRIMKEALAGFGKKISLEELSRLAGAGNSRAVRIWAQAGRRLGVVLSGVVNLLNPDIIVIGGGVANAGRVLFDAIRKTIAQRAMPVQVKSLRVAKAKLGNDAGLIGAAILVQQNSSPTRNLRRSFTQ